MAVNDSDDSFETVDQSHSFRALYCIIEIEVTINSKVFQVSQFIRCPSPIFARQYSLQPRFHSCIIWSPVSFDCAIYRLLSRPMRVQGVAVGI